MNVSGLKTLGVLDLCRQRAGLVGQFLLRDQPATRVDSAATLDSLIEIQLSPEGSRCREVEEEIALNWHYFLMLVEGMYCSVTHTYKQSFKKIYF